MKPDPFDAVSDAFTENDGGELPARFAGVPKAESAWRDLARLRAAARARSAPDESPFSRARAERALLAALRPRDTRVRARRRGAAIWATAAVCLAIGLVAGRSFEPGADVETAATDPGVANPEAVNPGVGKSEAEPLVPPAPVAEGHLTEKRVSDDAAYEHVLVRTAGPRPAWDERIQVAQGRVELVVAPLGAQDRFRVIAPDAEIEVVGTRFTVEVRDGHLIRVEVAEGEVELRRGATTRRIAAGELWRRVDHAAAPARSPTPRRSAASARAARPREEARPAERRTRAEDRAADLAPAEPSPDASLPVEAMAVASDDDDPLASKDDEAVTTAAFGESERFLSALAALDADDPEPALAQLEALRGSELAPETEYWRAVALERLGRTDEAVEVLATYAARFPNGPRAEEVELRRAVYEVRAGEVARARARLTALTESPRPEIARAAGRSLNGLEPEPPSAEADSSR